MSNKPYYFAFATKFTHPGYNTFVVETDEVNDRPGGYGPMTYYFMSPCQFKNEVKQYLSNNYRITGMTILGHEEASA